ncbi:hypothetical protein Syun_022497 [Stephania yunnanensis]|uniref:Uncharacterized protein n=1 Tax=Stephania yunnanensis TaxID=152371 RepID=A0AAP0I2U0_9MAGN
MSACRVWDTVRQALDLLNLWAEITVWLDCLEIFIGKNENPEMQLRDSKWRVSKIGTKSLVEARKGQQWRTGERRERGLCP